MSGKEWRWGYKGDEGTKICVGRQFRQLPGKWVREANAADQ